MKNAAHRIQANHSQVRPITQLLLSYPPFLLDIWYGIPVFIPRPLLPALAMKDFVRGERKGLTAACSCLFDAVLLFLLRPLAALPLMARLGKEAQRLGEYVSQDHTTSLCC